MTSIMEPMTPEDRDIRAFADCFNALYTGDREETIALMGLLCRNFGLDEDDPDDLTQFCKSMSVSLMMIADGWKRNGIPEITCEWTQ